MPSAEDYGGSRSSELRDDTFLTQKQREIGTSDDESATPQKARDRLLNDDSANSA